MEQIFGAFVGLLIFLGAGTALVGGIITIVKALKGKKSTQTGFSGENPSKVLCDDMFAQYTGMPGSNGVVSPLSPSRHRY